MELRDIGKTLERVDRNDDLWTIDRREGLTMRLREHLGFSTENLATIFVHDDQLVDLDSMRVPKSCREAEGAAVCLQPVLFTANPADQGAASDFNIQHGMIEPTAIAALRLAPPLLVLPGSRFSLNHAGSAYGFHN